MGSVLSSIGAVTGVGTLVMMAVAGWLATPGGQPATVEVRERPER